MEVSRQFISLNKLKNCSKIAFNPEDKLYINNNIYTIFFNMNDKRTKMYFQKRFNLLILNLSCKT